MRIAVMVSGAVGGYFGGRLAMAGHDVCFIARGEHLRAIRQTGLRVESPKGDFLVFPAEVNDDPAEVGAVELAIVSVKSWQLSEAAHQMRPLVGPETIVLPLLNGVEAADELAKALPLAQILGGLCRIIAYVEAPGRIRHSGMEPSLVFGELDNRLSERVESLKDALDRAGIQAEIASDFSGRSMEEVHADLHLEWDWRDHPCTHWSLAQYHRNEGHGRGLFAGDTRGRSGARGGAEP